MRFYEHSSRFSFACRDGPGRRREASPLSVPSALRARTLRVSPLNDTGNRAVGRPDRWARYLSSSQNRCVLACIFAAGVLRVSSKLGSSHRTLTTPVEAYAPPCVVNILPFWRVLKLVSTALLAPSVVSTLGPYGPRLSASQLFLSRPHPAAQEAPLRQRSGSALVVTHGDNLLKC